MAPRKKKGEAGEAIKYITRNKAIKQLQLGVHDFRRLCIWKGLYPRVPQSVKKAQKGDLTPRTLFLRNDISYLSHEPVIWKIRAEKIFRRKLRTLTSEREYDEADFFKKYEKPKYTLDHVVLERYPDFPSALRDLDDALSTCFLYAVMPNSIGIIPEFVQLCQKLTTEFLHFVIEARALRKAFISIKGYYYRAQIQGIDITWMMAHPFPPQIPVSADMRTMLTFVEFYSTLLGFINFKLYQSLNLYYPPKLETKIKASSDTTQKEERAYATEALSIPLRRTFVDEDAERRDDYDLNLLGLQNTKVKVDKEGKMKVQKQMSLFNNKKFFLARETNRESLTLVIRSGGGLVSWDATDGPGATYGEDDEAIVYQIVDRPDVETKYLSRYYIQPQWVYDSFNAGLLLPVQGYFVGATLPAHLSPFEESYKGGYVPPEETRLQAMQKGVEIEGDTNTLRETALETQGQKKDRPEEVIAMRKEKKKMKVLERKRLAVKTNQTKNPLQKMIVYGGGPITKQLAKEKEKEVEEDYILRSTMIHRKQKRLFWKVLKKESKKDIRAQTLMKKRITYETEIAKKGKAGAKGVNRKLKAAKAGIAKKT